MKGSIIPVGTILKIQSAGLVGSKRNAQDGNVYFGTGNRNVSILLIVVSNTN